MLIHECIECRTLSINRIAADDDPESIMEVFNKSRLLGRQTHTSCENQGILMVEDKESIYPQLYGQMIKTSNLL